MTSELYRQLIIDHSKNPRNFGKLKHPTNSCVGHNTLCGDKIEIQMRIEDGIIKEIAFNGTGCAISQASSSLLTQSLKGKPEAEIQKYSDLFRLMMLGKAPNGQLDRLENLSFFRSVPAYPSRLSVLFCPGIRLWVLFPMKKLPKVMTFIDRNTFVDRDIFN